MNDEVLGGLELDMQETAKPTHSPPVPAWRSFTSGCVSGMAAVVVGQVRRGLFAIPSLAVRPSKIALV